MHRPQGPLQTRQRWMPATAVRPGKRQAGRVGTQVMRAKPVRAKAVRQARRPGRVGLQAVGKPAQAQAAWRDRPVPQGKPPCITARPRITTPRAGAIAASIRVRTT